MYAQKFVDTLDLAVGETYRGDCPSCRGKNTFTASNDNGNILYNCYKNSCDISGSSRRNVDASTIKSILAGVHAPESYSEQDLCPLTLPPYVVPYETVDTPIDPTFLDRYMIDELDHIYYDVRQDRVVFPVLKNTYSTVIYDAVGRALTNRQPKWLRYGPSPLPYIHGWTYKYAVVVEDAISAYVVGDHFGDVCHGVALLGTQLTEYHKWYIKNTFDNVIVALDPDARDKTIKIAKELNGKALNIKDDLKYKGTEDFFRLAEMLYAEQ